MDETEEFEFALALEQENAVKQEVVEPEPEPRDFQAELKADQETSLLTRAKEHFTKTAQQGANVMAGVNTAGINTLDFIGTALNQAGGLMGIESKIPKFEDSKYIKMGMTPYGDQTDPSMRAPFTAGKWLAPMPMKGGTKFSPAANRVVPTGGYKYTMNDARMAGLATAGSEAAAKIFGDENAQWGELLGLKGLTKKLSTVDNIANTAPVVKQGGDWNMFDYLPAVTKSEKARKEAAATMLGTMHKPDLNAIDDAIDAGVDGTVAQLSQDQGLANLERAVEKGTPKATHIADVRETYDAGLRADIRAATTQVEGADEISKAAAAADIQERAAKLQQQAQKPVIAAEQAAEGGIDATIAAHAANQEKVAGAEALSESLRKNVLGQAKKPAEASVDLATAIDKAEAAYKTTHVQPKWDTFDGAAPIDLAPIKQVVADKLDKIEALVPAKAKDVIKQFKTQLLEIRDLKGKVPPAAFHYSILKIKKDLNAANVSGNFGPVEKEMADINAAMDDALAGMEGTYKAAKKASADFYATFKPDNVGATRAGSTPEQLADALGSAERGGVATGRQLEPMGSDVMKAQEANLLAEAARADRSGGLPAYSTSREELLETKFPQLKEKLDSVNFVDKNAVEVAADVKVSDAVLDAQRGRLVKSVAEAEKKSAEKTSGLTATLAKRDTAKYAQEPAKVIESILKDKDRGSARLTKLYTDLKKQGAEGSLISKVSDEVSRIISSPKADKMSVTRESADSFNALKPILEKSGIMSADEIASIERSINKGRTSERLHSAAKAQKLDDLAGEFDNLIASGATVLVSPAIGAKQSLVMNGAIRRVFRGMLKAHRKNPDMMREIENMLTDPKAFSDMVKKYDMKVSHNRLPPAEQAKTVVDKLMLRAMANTAAAQEEEE